MKRYREEIAPKLAEFKEHNITIVCEKYVEALGLRYFDKEGAINNVYTVNELLEGKLDDMQFDYIVGNPPYQTSVGDKDKQIPIWDTLVLKFFELLKENGEMSMIHPGGWRFSSPSANNNLHSIKEIYQNHKVTYAEFNDIRKGYEVFGQATDFDVMNVIKCFSNEPIIIHTKTDGKISMNIRDLNMIPTDNFDLFLKLKGKPEEEKVEIIFNSAYHTLNGGERCRVRKNRNDIFKYPVIDRIPMNSGVKYYYSNTRNNGHFNISKLILARAASSTILDLNGDYGMTQFAAGIVDTPENLVKIQKVLELNIFKTMKTDFCGIGGSNKNAIIDGLGRMFKFLKEFRKDFWKEFYTDEMEQELIAEGKLNEDGSLA